MAPLDARVEMFQKGQAADAFFNMKALAPRAQRQSGQAIMPARPERPMSEATEMFDTDFEDDESDVEDNSPRRSLQSSGRRSETTLSSLEEVHTPSPNTDEFDGFAFDLAGSLPKKPVEGPRGPHLFFRSSFDSNNNNMSSEEDRYVLSLSPMTPRPSEAQRARMARDVSVPRVPDIPSRHRHLGSLSDAVESLPTGEVAQWTPRQVADWMYNNGFEPSIVEKFEENDISGAILITLKFEDLKELDIPSFGQRTALWNEIHVLRGSAPASPKPPTPIEEVASPCIDVRSPRFGSMLGDCGHVHPKRRKSSRRRPKRQEITPLESVSIVGIEQLMPKPHKCAKGENCSKWRKQQRLIENFEKDHPASPGKGGSIWIAGDPGNPLTAASVENAVRPVSDAVPSVVASSDILGPSMPAFRHLEEASLRNVQLRDPQENVKQFLSFQHVHPAEAPENWSSEQPPTPPYEMFPTLPNPNLAKAPTGQQAPHTGLRALPRLAIPPPRQTAQAPPPRSASANQAFSPYRMERAEAMSPDLRNATRSPTTVYRFGTPFSEMDVPVTAVQFGPVARDASQSVPPNMSYRHDAPASLPPLQPLQRNPSRVSTRRPSVAMPQISENISTAPPTQTKFHAHQVQPAPRHVQHQHTSSYPWSPVTDPKERSMDDISHAGWMKKRKTKMLRHEWHEHHFTLKGTRLAMHTSPGATDTLEYIDVDDYAIACSSLASGSKLNAAFKAMNISRGNKDKKDEAAFSFQLIPAAIDRGMKLKKRESMIQSVKAGGEGKDAGKSGKTHYFAVRSRDERIDWMRELMLAKALKQKSEGYEINVNGNMI